MKYLYLLFSFYIFLSCNEKKKESIIDISHSSKYYDSAKNSSDENTSFKYYNYAKDDFLAKKDSLMAGKSLVNMAIIMSNQGNYYGSLQTSIEANKILSTKDPTSKETLASNYNCMAIVSENLKQYDKAIEYYEKAIESTHDTIIRLAYLNNIGNSYLLKKDYHKALQYFNNVLSNKKSKINRIDYARAINNYGKVKYLMNSNFNPIPIYEKSFQIRQQENDLPGQNYVLASFTDYYQAKDNQKALMYALKRYSVTRKMRNPDDELETLQKLIVLDPKNYLKYFHQFQFINDSIQLARNSSSNKFALIRYETEERKAENQKLKADTLQQDNYIFKQNIGLVSLSLALICGLFWYQKRKKRLQQEKELEVKNTELKYSKKVHDVVANGIYQVMTKIENQENLDKNEMLDDLEFVYEKSRDISYEKMDVKEGEEDFSKKISHLIASFKNNMVNTYTAGNEKNTWLGLKPSKEEEVFQIIREMLINMKKHSHADRVVFKFERINDIIKIQYTDNGIGVSGDMIYKNGLTNTGTRIEVIDGEIIFDTKTEKGLKINISFPVS